MATTTPAQEKQTYNFQGYIAIWGGQTISLLGSSIVQFAIIWWLTIETGSALVLGVATFLGFGSTMLVTLFAGVYVDRWSRKKIIGIVDSLEAFVTIVLIALFALNIVEYWHVLTILTLRGIFQGFHQPSIQAIIPLLVPPEKLSRVNGWSYLAGGLVNLAGPLIGAGLLVLFSIQQILWIDAITFAIAVVPLVLTKIPSIKHKTKKTTYRKDWAEGFVFIREKKGLLSLLSAFTTANMIVGSVIFTLLPLYVTIVHNGSPDDFAVLLASFSVGILLGGSIMSVWKGFHKNVIGVIVGLYVMAFSLLLVAIVGFNPGSPFWVQLSAIALIISGFALPLANVSSQTIWQVVVPPEKMGRVFSVRVVIAQGTLPIAALVFGAIAEISGIIPVFLAAAILELFALTYLWFFTGLPTVEKQLGIIKDTEDETPGITLKDDEQETPT